MNLSPLSRCLVAIFFAVCSFAVPIAWAAEQPLVPPPVTKIVSPNLAQSKVPVAALTTSNDGSSFVQPCGPKGWPCCGPH